MDIKLTETLDGGDFELVEVQDEAGVFYDLVLDGGMETAVYISHFGGNVEASTTGNEKPGELRSDFWGNTLMETDPVRQANSELERALIELPITSGNLLKIEDFSKSDIQWMLDENLASEIFISALIVAPEFVQVIDTINQPGKDTKFKSVWDFDRNRLLEG